MEKSSKNVETTAVSSRLVVKSTVWFLLVVAYSIFGFFQNSTLVQRILLIHGDHSMEQNPKLENYPIHYSTSRTSTARSNQVALVSSNLADLPRPLCTREQIRNGRWIPITREKPIYARFETWKCYPENAMLQKQNPPIWKDWEWIPNDSLRSTSTLTSSSVATTIRNSTHLSSSHVMPDEFTFHTENKESTCEWTNWDKELFCKLARNKTILIAGDSLSWEQYASLTMLNGVHVDEKYHKRSLFKTHISHVCIEKTTRKTAKNATNETNPLVSTKIAFRRTDFLEFLPTAIEEVGFPIDIFVLNRGAHYRPDQELLQGINNTIRFLKEWHHDRAHGNDHDDIQDDSTSQNDEPLVIWRTTVPGHYKCPKYAEPFHGNVSEIEEQIRLEGLAHDKNAVDSRGQWHWQDFKHQNELVVKRWEDLQRELNRPKVTLLDEDRKLQTVQEHSSNDSSYVSFSNSINDGPKRNKLHIEIMDAYDINIYRRDAHRGRIPLTKDCIHSCFPGKMDVYNEILLHYLRQLAYDSVSTKS